MFFIGAQAVSFTSRCSAYMSTQELVGSSAEVKVPFNTTLYDNDSEFHVQRVNSFRAWKDGVYHIAVQLGYLELVAGTIIQLRLKYNGGTIKHNTVNVHGADDMNVAVSCDVPMVNGDYIEIWTEHNAGASKYITALKNLTYIDIHRFA